MSTDYTQVYHVVAYEFEGRDRALQVAELVRKGSRAGDYKVAAWAVVEIDDRGKARVRQSGHGGKGTAVGMGAGALLGLVGGPAGLLVWTVGGALVGGLAGKYMGHQFDPDALKELTVGMGPNTSAILVVIEDKAAQEVATEMGQYGAKVVTLTLGSQLSGEMASFAAVSLADVTEDDAAVETEAAETQEAQAPVLEAKEQLVDDSLTSGPGEAYDPIQAQADVINRTIPHL